MTTHHARAATAMSTARRVPAPEPRHLTRRAARAGARRGDAARAESRGRPGRAGSPAFDARDEEV